MTVRQVVKMFSWENVEDEGRRVLKVQLGTLTQLHNLDKAKTWVSHKGNFAPLITISYIYLYIYIRLLKFNTLP